MTATADVRQPRPCSRSPCSTAREPCSPAPPAAARRASARRARSPAPVRAHQRRGQRAGRVHAHALAGIVAPQMTLYDLPLDELEKHRCSAPEPAGLDAFWERTLAEARSLATPPCFEPYRPEAYGALAVDDVTFSGFGGHPIRGWFLRPRGAAGAAAVPRQLHRLRRRPRVPGRSRAVRGRRARRAGDGHARPGRRVASGRDGRSGRRRIRRRAPGRDDARHLALPRRTTSGGSTPTPCARSRPRRSIRRWTPLASRSAASARAAGSRWRPPRSRPGLVRLCMADMPYLCDIERGVADRPRAAVHRADALPGAASRAPRRDRRRRCATSTARCSPRASARAASSASG